MLRRKTRSVLTVIAMAIAVGSVVALVGISNGFEQSFLEVYTSAGIDLVVVKAGVQERLNSGLDEKLTDVLRKVPHVTRVTPSLLDMISFEKQKLYGVPIRGTEVPSPMLEEMKLRTGRMLQADDKDGIVIGFILATSMNKKVGDTIELYEQEPFKIVGIVESHSVFDNGAITILLEPLQRLMDRAGQVTGFAVQIEHPDDPNELDGVIHYIDHMGGGLMALGTKEHVGSITQIRIIRGMSWVTSVIGLLIGAIGVLNTMFMSVMERTREIGVLRAIGWRKPRIVRMILAESIVMSVVGAIVGTLGAIWLTKFLSGQAPVSGLIAGDIAWDVVGEGFLVGIVGAAYPAYRGARLLPTEALRHD
jgi:putative ABC transport system permease protein